MRIPTHRDDRTDEGATDSAAPYQLIQEPDAGYQPILDLIRSAQHCVQMTMYELSDPDAVAALIDAHHRDAGVTVTWPPTT